MADILDFRVKNGLAVTNTATIESTLQSTSTNTGALTVTGGVGIGKNLNVGGDINSEGIIATGLVDFTSTTSATSTNTGALNVVGGVGIGGALYVGDTLRVLSTSNAISPTTGALVIDGGLGIAKDFWVGGTLFASVTGNVTTATHLAGGTDGQLLYQTSPGRTGFAGPGTSGQILVSAGTSAPVYTNTSSIYVGYSVTGTNINAGVAGSIPFQSAPGVTTFVGIGGTNDILTSNGTSPVYSSTGSIIVGSATTATNANNIASLARTTSAAHYLTFVDSNNSAVGYEALYTTSTVIYNPATRRLTVGGTVAPNATLDVQGSMFVSGATTVTNVTNASNTATGAFQVRGGAAVGLNLVVGSTATILSQAYSSSTVAGNALYVAGGVGIGKGLYVGGPVLFQDNVTFAGTTTNVFSTNTVYTDNFIDLHFPSDGGPAGIWTVDDGKDIGHIYHHYKDDTGDEHGALIWHNASDELRWYMGDVEFVGGSQTYNFSTGTYGKFRTGEIYLEGTTASTSPTTGVLTVGGGAGIVGDLWVGGTIFGAANVSGTVSTATNLSGGTAGQIVYQSTSGVSAFHGPGTIGQILLSNGTNGPLYTNTASVYVGSAVIADNINKGNTGQLVFQSNTSTTGFVGTGTAGQILVSAGTTSTGPVFTNTATFYVGFAGNANNVEVTNDTGATSAHFITFVNTASGYNRIKTASNSGLVYIPSSGFLGVNRTTPTAHLDINGAVLISGVTTVTNVTNATTTATGAFQVRGGAAVGLDLRVGGLATVGSTLAVTGDTTLTGDLVVNGGDITSSASTFNLLNTGVTTLNLAGAGTAVTIGAATGFTDIRNLTTITNVTDSLTTATGALVVRGGMAVAKDLRVGGTLYATVSGSITNANTATNLAGGTAGQVPYQTAPGATSFYGPGTAGQLLVSNGTAAPVYTNTSSISVGRATTATNINGGATGAVPYQSSTGTTTFVNIGANGTILYSNGTTPLWTATSGLTAGQADIVKITNDVATATAQYITFVGTSTGYSGIKTAAASGIAYIPSTGRLLVGASTATNTGQLQVVGTTRIINNAIEANALLTTVSATSATIETRYNTPIALGVNAVEIARLSSVGLGVGIDPAFRLDVSGATRISGVTTVTNTTNATNTATGALQVVGGVGVGGDMYVGGGILTVGNATGATSVRIDAGPGIATYIAKGGGTDTSLNNQYGAIQFADSAFTNKGFIQSRSIDATNTRLDFLVLGTGNFRTPLSLSGTTASIALTTVASSTTTGALVVTGGVGIGQDLYVGGTIYGTIFGSISGTASTATNLAGGTAGQVPYQSAPGVTAFYGPGTAGQLLVSGGAAIPVYTNTGSIFVGRATTSTNINGGAAGSIPYNTAAGITALLAIGTAGQLLTVNAGSNAPQWSNTATLVVGFAENANNVKVTNDVATTASQYLTFVNTSTGYAGVKTAATTSLVYVPGTTRFGIGTGTPTATLDINGTVSISGVTTVTNTTNATNTTTGALQVRGGVGIGLDLDVGGAVDIGGDLAVNGGDITSNATTFNILATTATIVNFATSASTLNVGWINGTTTVRNQLVVSTNTNATSTTTGALRVAGGAGFGGVVHASGMKISSFTTNSNSTDAIPLDVQGSWIRIGDASTDFNPASGIGIKLHNSGVIHYSLALTGTNFVISNTGVDGNQLLPATRTDLVTVGNTGNIDVAGAGTFGGDVAINGGDLTTNQSTFNLVNSGVTTLNVAGAGTAITVGSTVGYTNIRNLTTITNTANATTVTNGALQVAGGVGIQGNLYVGGTIVGNVSVTGSITTASNIAGGTAGQVPYQTGVGATSFYGPGTAGQLLVSNGAAAPVYTNTSSIYVGRAALADDLVGGTAGAIAYQDAANSTVFLALSGTAKSLLTAGATAPTYITQVQAQSGTGSATTSTGQSLVVTGGGLGVQGDSYFGNSAAVRVNLKVEGNTNATNQTTGALQVVGGIGAQGDIHAAGAVLDAVRIGVTAVNQIDTTAGNLVLDSTGGTVQVNDNLTIAGNLTVQGTTTVVDSTVTNIVDPIITIGGGAGGAAPAVDDNKDRGIAFQWNNGLGARTGFFGFDDSTGYFTFVSSATITNEVVAPAGGTTRGAIDANLAGGTAMSIPYQSASNVSTFLAAGTAGFVLSTNGTGSAPSWINPTGLAAGTATNADNIRTVAQTANAVYYPTFVDSNNAAVAYEAVYTTSSFVVNAQTGNVGVGATPTAKLHVFTGANSDAQRWEGLGYSTFLGMDATGSYIYANSASRNFTLGANSSRSQLVLDTAGNVGMGAATPAFTAGSGLEIQRAGTATLRLDCGSNATEFRGLTGGTEIFQLSTGFLDLGTNATSSVRIHSTNNVTIGTTTDGGYKLQVNGSFAATTKSFVIDHPTKEGMTLRYGSLEGPENGVYVRGRCKGKGVIELPDYWTGLVDPDSITVTLTPIGKSQNLFVKEIKDNKVKIGGSRKVDCFYTVWAERKDVAKLEVEFKK
jgi:hypothetical protein